LIKFIPFSIFIFVPGTELVLPIYLLFLPRSVPTQFTFDYQYDKLIQKLETEQKLAQECLSTILRTKLNQLGHLNDDFIKPDSYKNAFFKHY
jgi:LETM1 and EF-hand domain-containing protein 1